MQTIQATTTLESIAATYKAAADVLRLNILKVLSHNSYGVLELCTILNHKQSGLSHHLKVLANSGLVETRREGNTIFYRRSTVNDANAKLRKSIFEHCDTLELDADIQQQINVVFTERANQSQLFFDKVSEDFNEHQERIADRQTYAGATLELLDSYLNSSNNQSVLEIGPGDGQLLKDLDKRFAKVTALDTSLEMLNRAKQNNAGSNIHFLHGDIEHQDIGNTQYDCIIIAMVLHHVPAPAELIKHIAKKLKPQGILAITDLCAHQQGWAQTLCGDLWMGFESTEITNWAHDAGLLTNNSLYLAQRNGFQIQAHQFLKPH